MVTVPPRRLVADLPFCWQSSWPCLSGGRSIPATLAPGSWRRSGPWPALSWWSRVAPLPADQAVVLRPCGLGRRACLRRAHQLRRGAARERVQDWLGLNRNPYDRLGDFMQGFAPAIAVREILWRRSPLRRSRWLPVLVVTCCLAISACWELLEWLGALVVQNGDPAFLGGQGDPWDTQWDLFLALVGSILALALFSRLHDRQLVRIDGSRSGVSPFLPPVRGPSLCVDHEPAHLIGGLGLHRAR